MGFSSSFWKLKNLNFWDWTLDSEINSLIDDS